MTGSKSFAESVRRSLPRYLVDAVQRVSCLDDPATLRRLLHKFSSELGAALDTTANTSQRGLLVRLMEGLCEQPAGLIPLLETLELWEGETNAVLNLKVATAVWEVELLSPEDWEELFRLLDGLRIPNLQQWYAEFLRQHRRYAPPAHCTEPWAAFLHSATLNARPGEPLPCFQFLRRLAFAADGEHQFAISDWADSHDPSPPVDESDELPMEQSETSERTEIWRPSDYLIIRLRPLLDSDRESLTILSHWWRVHPGGQQHGEDRRIDLEHAEREVRALLLHAESDWAYFLKSELAIEFVLPWELLQLPVERWQKAPFRGVGGVLGEDHPVVVRSLERLDRRDLHGRWGSRWDALSEGHAGHIHWFPEDGITRLLSDPPPAVVVLSVPPGGTHHGAEGDYLAPDELGEALRAGVPVVIWDRRGVGDAASRTALQTILNSHDPRLLPSVFRTLRIASRGSDSKDAPTVGRHLALLWDDPYRLPVASGDTVVDRRRLGGEQPHERL
ncbi:hypothetical protein OG967_39635 [Streptomyces phaeochromogenes]